MKRLVSALCPAVLILALAACQEAAPSLDYVGVSVVDGSESDLALTFERWGDRLTGDYTVDAAHGTFRGSAAGDAVTAELSPSADCTYAFEGVLTDATLTGAFEPTGCPGGHGGTWSLERQ